MHKHLAVKSSSALLSLFALLFLVHPSKAQAPQLVRDSWRGSTGISPMRLLTFNDRLCFYAYETVHGGELWEYLDEDTPRMVHDIYPGANTSGSCPEDDHMVVFNNKLYFQGGNWDTASGKATGDELFVYDALSIPRLDLRLGKLGTGSNPYGLIVVGNKLYFTADTNNIGYHLYSYDGTNAPTVFPIKPANFGMPARMLAAYNNRLYFTYDSLNGKGKELYALNPATNTWKMVADIYPGPPSSMPYSWLNAWNKLFFVATDSAHGRELYSYDGTTVKRLTDLAPGTKNAMPNTFHRLIDYKGAIYFNGTATGINSPLALYKWDSATGNVTQISPAGMDFTNMFRPIVFNGSLYFYGKTSTTGWEVWTYDGTSCKMVTDLNPGTADGVKVGEFAIYKNVLYFCGNNGATGFELYRIYPSSNAVTSVRWKGQAIVFPNPATTSATLSITLPSAQSLHVTLTDINGRVVFTSGLQSLNAGANEIRLPIEKLAPGQYFYRIDKGDGFVLTQGALVRQ